MRQEAQHLAVLLTPDRRVGQALEAVEAPRQVGGGGVLRTDKALSDKHSAVLSVTGGVWFLSFAPLAMTLCLTTLADTQAESIGHERKNKAGESRKEKNGATKIIPCPSDLFIFCSQAHLFRG